MKEIGMDADYNNQGEQSSVRVFSRAKDPGNKRGAEYDENGGARVKTRKADAHRYHGEQQYVRSRRLQPENAEIHRNENRGGDDRDQPLFRPRVPQHWLEKKESKENQPDERRPSVAAIFWKKRHCFFSIFYAGRKRLPAPPNRRSKPKRGPRPTTNLPGATAQETISRR